GGGDDLLTEARQLEETVLESLEKSSIFTGDFYFSVIKLLANTCWCQKDFDKAWGFEQSVLAALRTMGQESQLQEVHENLQVVKEAHHVLTHDNGTVQIVIGSRDRESQLQEVHENLRLIADAQIRGDMSLFDRGPTLRFVDWCTEDPRMLLSLSD